MLTINNPQGEFFILEEGSGEEIIRDLAHRSTKEAA